MIGMKSEGVCNNSKTIMCRGSWLKEMSNKNENTKDGVQAGFGSLITRQCDHIN